MTPKPFALEIPQVDIEDLKARLARTRLPDQAPDVRLGPMGATSATCGI